MGQTNIFNVTGMISGIFSNHKGMLGNLLGGFIVILIGVSLLGPIAQELNNVANCNSTLLDTNLSSLSPEGSTDSFGGGGANRFGGYDGEVKHKTFLQSVADTSLIKTDKSILNPDCVPIVEGTWGATMLKLVPGFFALAIMVAAMAMIYAALRSGGMLGGGVDI
jgi:hypothetical protein